MPKDTFIEVEMSYMQFAEAITSLNRGAGVPVTVRFANGRTMEPCPFTSKSEQLRSEFNAGLEGLAAAVRDATARAEELFAGKKPLTKAEKEELLSVFGRLSMAVNSNIPFVRERFDEQTDKTVMEAKGNIEGFFQNRMNALANAAIAQNLEAGGGGSGAEAPPGLEDRIRQTDPPAAGERRSVIGQIRAGAPARENRAPRGRKREPGVLE
jgi:hypothetical protein